MARVGAYILATKSHACPIEDNDEDEDLRLFLDIDMSVLGQPREGAWFGQVAMGSATTRRVDPLHTHTRITPTRPGPSQATPTQFPIPIPKHKIKLHTAYLRYAGQIRREYAHVPRPSYCTARAAVLTTFLGRARLYASEHYHARLEARARENVAAEVALLRAGAIPGEGDAVEMVGS